MDSVVRRRVPPSSWLLPRRVDLASGGVKRRNDIATSAPRSYEPEKIFTPGPVDPPGSHDTVVLVWRLSLDL